MWTKWRWDATANQSTIELIITDELIGEYSK